MSASIPRLTMLAAGLRAVHGGAEAYTKHAAYTLLWQAQDGLCGCGCGRAMVSHRRFPLSGDRDTLDHVWPRAFHGPDALGNLLLLTRKCNERKGQSLPAPIQMAILKDVNERLGWPTPSFVLNWERDRCAS